QKLAALGSDPDPLVRYQRAFTLDSLPKDQRLRAAITLASSGENDSWTTRALLNSSADIAAELFAALPKQGPEDFVSSLAALIGSQNRPADVAAVVASVDVAKQPLLAFRTASSLAAGLQSRGRTLSDADPDGKLRPVFAEAKGVATNQPIVLPRGQTAAATF